MVQVNIGVIEDLLQQVYTAKATDLLLTAGVAPLQRVDGQLVPFPGRPALTDDDVETLIVGCLDPDSVKKLEVEREIDFAFTWKGEVRFRANAFHQRGSLALSLRVIPLEIPSMEELRIPPQVHQFLTRSQGLVLVTGPTGSGKSTTLASMLDWINENRQCHIVTIEDPLEYLHHHKKSAINQREVGDDTKSFERALRSVLREDPDVLLVGEMRDVESIQTTLTIAETGHLVFATLHTNDTATALDRVVDVFPTDRQEQIRVQLASTLLGVLAQRLVPKVDGGLVAAFEVMFANHAVRNLVREGKTAQIRNVIMTNQRDGMQTLEMDLTRLVAEGTCKHEDAAVRAVVPKDVKPPLGPPARGGTAPATVPAPPAAEPAPAPADEPATGRHLRRS
jgi:twitching motility protein PilT